MNLIDLSVTINEQTPVYPGDPATKVEPAGALARDGYQDHHLSIGTHAGTHIDAPSHMLPDADNVNDLPLERFCGRGVLVEAGRSITLEAFRRADIQAGDIVLVHTGMSEVYYQDEYYENYPDLTEDIGSYLIEKQVKAVGVDMCSIDHEPFAVHRQLLGAGVLIVENLTNLQALQGNDFKVYVFPLKLEVDGAPVRAVAELMM